MQCGRPTPQGPQPLARTSPEAACCVCVQLHLSQCAISTLSSAACVPLLFLNVRTPSYHKAHSRWPETACRVYVLLHLQNVKKVTMHHQHPKSCSLCAIALPQSHNPLPSQCLLVGVYECKHTKQPAPRYITSILSREHTQCVLVQGSIRVAVPAGCHTSNRRAAKRPSNSRQ